MAESKKDPFYFTFPIITNLSALSQNLHTIAFSVLKTKKKQL